MLTVINRLWSWMPGPLSVVCAAVVSWFFILVFAKLVKIIVDFVKEIISLVKGLLISWGIGL